MTTYRKDVKEHVLLKNSDTLSLYQNEVRGYLHATHTRTNCLVGVTVISILIGSAALAISTLLLLQNFEIVVEENVKFEELEMRIKYLEHLTESLEQAERQLKKLDSHQGTSPPPRPPPLPLPPQKPSTRPPRPSPQTPPTRPPRPPRPSPQTPPTRPPRPPRPSPQTPRPLQPQPQPRQDDDIFALPEPQPRQDEDVFAPWKRPVLPPVDDEENPDEGVEGSGEGCPLNPPRPICPVGMRICSTKERCSKFVCCRA